MMQSEFAHVSDLSRQSLSVAIVGPDVERITASAQALRDSSSSLMVEAIGVELGQLLTVMKPHPPDILVVDAGNLSAVALTQIERVAQLYPDLDVILLTNDQSPDLLLRAIRARVREVQPINDSVTGLIDAVQRVSDKHESAHNQEGKVLAFISCRGGGGGGATFLATNTAYELADLGQRVILIDLNLQYGDAAMYLSDQPPTSNLADVLGQIERVDDVFLAASLVRVHPNLGVLAAPQDAAHALSINPDHIDVLLRLARKHYDYVVLDTDRRFDALTVRALDGADWIYTILQISVPFIRDGKRLLDAFRELGYPPEKIQVMVNRFEKQSVVPLQQLEETLGVRVVRTFPNEHTVVSASIDQGVPVVRMARNSSIARSLRQFAESLIAAPGAKKRNWLDRILGRD